MPVLRLRNAIRNLRRDHGFPLLFFTAVSLAVTWPTVRNFSTLLTSDGGDAKQFLWHMWHVCEALRGETSFFHSSLLFFPAGISLLTHATGPLIVLTSLPFWPFGRVAAYNGSLILDVGLTGYSGFLLAREAGLRRLEAVFAGLMLLLSEMHLAGLLGHKTKTFMVLAPLTLLAFLRMSKAGSRRVWSFAAALLLFATLLYSGWQFILTAAAVGFMAIVVSVRSSSERRPELLLRFAIFAAVACVLIAPMLLAVHQTVGTSGIEIDRRAEAAYFSPDLVEFFLPSRYSRSLGQASRRFLESKGISWTIESTVSLSWVGLILVFVAVFRFRHESRPWLLLLAICVVVSLGPFLKVLGQSRFTYYGLPVALPYAVLSGLPGLEFARTPGRVMHLGFIALAISAGFGLALITGRFPRRRAAIVVGVSLLLSLETWPAAWPQEALRRTPQFYQALGNEPGNFGVLDLPLQLDPSSQAIAYSSQYQMYQMVHKKGILLGYVARGYLRNPRVPCLSRSDSPTEDVLVDGVPSDCARAVLYDLAASGYRYVVQHKPQEEYPGYKPGSWGDLRATELINMMFCGAGPTIDDELVRVYPVPAPAQALPDEPVLTLEHGWHDREPGWRWASSPASLKIISPKEQKALLELVPQFLHDPLRPGSVGSSGALRVEAHGRVAVVSVQAGEIARIPLDLKAGAQIVSLTLSGGSGKSQNFRPADYSGTDTRLLSFALQSINLITSLASPVISAVATP